MCPGWTVCRREAEADDAMKNIKTILLLISIFSFSSCARIQEVVGLERRRDFSQELRELPPKDYHSHLEYLGEVYLRSPGVSTLEISERSREYLLSVYNNLVENNEILLSESETPQFFLIDSATPFYFSLPNSQFFFSSGLIDKYLRNEDLLVAMLTHEVVKSVRGIYTKRTLVPVGYIGTERILQMTRVGLPVKMEVNKWSYFVMKRAGYDSSAYLNWLQTQNKNTLDFTMQLGDTRTISREEFLFKNFMVSEDGQEGFGILPSNSSQEFYYFLNDLRRQM